MRHQGSFEAAMSNVVSLCNMLMPGARVAMGFVSDCKSGSKKSISPCIHRMQCYSVLLSARWSFGHVVVIQND